MPLKKNLPKLTRDRNLNSRSSKELNLLSKTFPQRNVQAQMVLLVKSIKLFKEEEMPNFHRLFQKIQEKGTVPSYIPDN